MTFDQLPLSDFLKKRLGEKGFTTPTPIQEQSIPLLLEKRDLVGIAQTGTGKTLAFSLPLIQALSGGVARARMPRAIILAPTRELAAQNMKILSMLTEGTPLKAGLIIGGESAADQKKVLNDGVDILVATPGRLIDQCDRGVLLLAQTHHVIIDEADRMLDMGFIPDIEKILSRVFSHQRQTVMFSATMPPAIEQLAQKFLKNPAHVKVAPPATVTTNVSQTFVLTTPRSRQKSFEHVLTNETVTQGIVFANRKRDVDAIAALLEKQDVSIGVLHGDIAQSKRSQVLDDFHQKKITLLVASDVAARGLDVKDISHVFNMEIPVSTDDYVHRIGRTGRAGSKGHAFTFVTPDQEKEFGRLEKVLKGTGTLIDDRPLKQREKLPFKIKMTQGDALRAETKAPSKQTTKAAPPKAEPVKTEKNKAELLKTELLEPVKITTIDHGAEKPTGFGAHTPSFIKG